MNIYKIHIWKKRTKDDAILLGIRKQLLDLYPAEYLPIKLEIIYFLGTENSKEEVVLFVEENLVDPIIEGWNFCEDLEVINNFVEIVKKPQVMDPVKHTVMKVAEHSNFKLKWAHTGVRYYFKGKDRNLLEEITKKYLCNTVIEEYRINNSIIVNPISQTYKFQLVIIPIRKLKNEELMKLSKERGLALDINEMKCIQHYFRKINRDPTDVELETIAQTWSEHCIHKTFKSTIKFGNITINNLLKSTIVEATNKLNKRWCVCVFEDNAGIIRFDSKYNLCFKVETHNHPSAVEPYGGAGTGIGGVIRDILGTGLGAKPILNTDIFFFGPPNTKNIPRGTLSPLRIMRGVVSGVRDYGNRMGIPTANGSVFFEEGFITNPLVFCGTVGLIPRDKSFKKVSPNSKIVLVGGRTGRDGIHGATFSSETLNTEDSLECVQIGNPIEEKKLMDFLIKARDMNLFEAITDCGAGGLSSAVGEMGKNIGAKVWLERVPLKYEGLSYTEIWISEAQERMVLSVPPSCYPLLEKIAQEEDVLITEIGEFVPTNKLELFYKNQKVCELDMNFLHKGIPLPVKNAKWSPPLLEEPILKEKVSYNKDFIKIISSLDICSKEDIIRQYDHEVQGCSVIKPLRGIHQFSPTDACVIRPYKNSKKLVAVANGVAYLYGKIDPYWMAVAAIEEAIRQQICVGADPDRIALLDNFAWGDVKDERELGALVRCAQGCKDAAIKLKCPFISGKDSLNNQYQYNGKSYSIPYVLVISSIGIIHSIEHTITSEFKHQENFIGIVGLTKDELGGSHYYRIHGYIGKNVPKIDFSLARKIYKKIYKAIKQKLIISCHDVSEGGIPVAVSEMCFAKGLGAKIDIDKIPRTRELSCYEKLFSESLTRFIVEIPKGKEEEIISFFNDIPFNIIGKVTTSKKLTIYNKREKLIDLSIDKIYKVWREPLKKYLT